MRLTITPDDNALAALYRKAVKGTDYGSICPTAQALLRLGYTQVYVGPNYATVKKGDWRGRFALPAHLTDAILEWDDGLFAFRAGDYELLPVKIPVYVK